MPRPQRHESPDADVVTLTDGIIELNFAFSNQRVEAVNAVPGAAWVSKTKSWTAPRASAAEALKFARHFNLRVEGDLISLAAAQAKRRFELVQLSEAPDAMIWEDGLGDLMDRMKPDQRVGLAYIMATNHTLVAMDPGMGKTLVALAAFEAAGAWPALVTCPAPLVLNWQRELDMWLPHRTSRVVVGRSNFPTEPADLTIVGWPNLAHWTTHDALNEKHKDGALGGYLGFAADESHYAKSPGAARTKAAIKIAKTIPAHMPVMGLTGTPITNRPAEYASQLDMLGVLKSEFGGRPPFVRRYAQAFRDAHGHMHEDGAAELPELHSKLTSTCMVRRKKSGTTPEHQVLIVPGDPKVMKEYRKAEADIAEYMAEKARQIAEEMGVSPYAAAVRAKMKAQAAQHLVKMSALRRLAALAKHDALDQVISERVESESKVIVAAHHRDIVDSISGRWGGLKIMGGMSPAATEEVKATFQVPYSAELPDHHVITINMIAGGVGHTLTAANEVVFAELPWTPSEIKQVWSRADRLGQQRQVYVTYVLLEDSIDLDIWGVNGAKARVIDAAVDGKFEEDEESLAKTLVNKFLDMGLKLEPKLDAPEEPPLVEDDPSGHYDGF
jgi:SNF2 family DNA or RNA helicase